MEREGKEPWTRTQSECLQRRQKAGCSEKSGAQDLAASYSSSDFPLPPLLSHPSLPAPSPFRLRSYAAPGTTTARDPQIIWTCG